jgi:hypothetical protein
VSSNRLTQEMRKVQALYMSGSGDNLIKHRAELKRLRRSNHRLTDKLTFGPLALNESNGLNTWSGLLMDEDSPLDDWTYTGLLVDIRPINVLVG